MLASPRQRCCSVFILVRSARIQLAFHRLVGCTGVCCACTDVCLFYAIANCCLVQLLIKLVLVCDGRPITRSRCHVFYAKLYIALTLYVHRVLSLILHTVLFCQVSAANAVWCCRHANLRLHNYNVLVFCRSMHSHSAAFAAAWCLSTTLLCWIKMAHQIELIFSLQVCLS